MRHSGKLIVLILGLVLCSEIASGAPWIQEQGRLWWKLGVSLAEADEKFANDRLDATKVFPDGTPVRAGDRIPFDFVTGGDYRFQSYDLEVMYGLTDRIEVGVGLPFLHTVFENDNDEVEPGTGFGDVRLESSVGLWRGEKGVLAATVRWKIPTADVPRSVFAQPLGEGQHDLGLGLSAGWSFWPRGWIVASVNHTWRAENEELGFDPGNEVRAVFELGWQVTSAVAFAQRIERITSGEWTSREFGFEQEIGHRELLGYAPSLLFGLDRLGLPALLLELGASFSLAGEDLPTIRQFRLGFMSSFDTGLH